MHCIFVTLKQLLQIELCVALGYLLFLFNKEKLWLVRILPSLSCYCLSMTISKASLLSVSCKSPGCFSLCHSLSLRDSCTSGCSLSLTWTLDLVHMIFGMSRICTFFCFVLFLECQVSYFIYIFQSFKHFPKDAQYFAQTLGLYFVLDLDLLLLFLVYSRYFWNIFGILSTFLNGSYECSTKQKNK